MINWILQFIRPTKVPPIPQSNHLGCGVSVNFDLGDDIILSCLNEEFLIPAPVAENLRQWLNNNWTPRAYNYNVIKPKSIN